MTTLIKIKRDSIKKNPNAGRDTYHLPMAWRGEFETNIPKKRLPEYFKDRIDRVESNLEYSIYYGSLYEPPDDKIVSFIQEMIQKGFEFKFRFPQRNTGNPFYTR